jgi:pilus assembly protein CpaE
MKIALISPNKANLQEMHKVVVSLSHSAIVVEGGKSKMRSIAESDQPDLLIVEGMCCDPNELEQIEYVTTHFPGIAVVLLCATNTPEFLINSMRAGVREVLPSPVSGSALEAAISRIAAKTAVSKGNNLGKTLAFMPCKGGSGATFLATNFGYQLAESKSVLLIDLNLQFGDALSFIYEGKPSTTITDVSRDISRLDASLLASAAVKVTPSYSVLAAPDDPAQAMEVKPEHIEAILKLAVTQYDFVLLDMPRILDTLTIKAMDRAYRIFPVLQADLPHLRHASKLLNIFKSLEYSDEKIEFIINRFEKRNDIGVEKIRHVLGSYFLHTMPNSYKDVSTSINHGNPLKEMSRSNVVAKNLADFALSLSPKQDESRGIISRIFKRA